VESDGTFATSDAMLGTDSPPFTGSDPLSGELSGTEPDGGTLPVTRPVAGTRVGSGTSDGTSERPWARLWTCVSHPVTWRFAVVLPPGAAPFDPAVEVAELVSSVVPSTVSELASIVASDRAAVVSAAIVIATGAPTVTAPALRPVAVEIVSASGDALTITSRTGKAAEPMTPPRLATAGSSEAEVTFTATASATAGATVVASTTPGVAVACVR
jgi:hypothetical protein